MSTIVRLKIKRFSTTKVPAKEEMIDHRLKMDETMVSNCKLVLKKLIAHPYGDSFYKPVDLVAFKIPDHLSLASNPMDLGTIRSKLVKDLYSTPAEFEADIRLTFSNAMKYNPPCNEFYKMALELDSLFDAEWKSVTEPNPRSSRQGFDVEERRRKIHSDALYRKSSSTELEPRKKEASIEKKVLLGTARASDHRSGSKRARMERRMVCRCIVILKRLMKRVSEGSKLEKDLHRVRLNLVKDLYATPREFEADIRRTFSNAIKYNRSSDPIHKKAQKLNSKFAEHWRLVESENA